MKIEALDVIFEYYSLEVLIFKEVLIAQAVRGRRMLSIAGLLYIRLCGRNLSASLIRFMEIDMIQCQQHPASWIELILSGPLEQSSALLGV